VVGPSAGGVALEPRFVCGHEMSLLLLPGTGVGSDARARGAARRNDRGLARFGRCWRACSDVDDGGVLFVAGIARVGGGMALCFERGPGAQSEKSCAWGGVMGKDVNEVQEMEEVKEKGVSVSAFFDLDGTLMPMPSLEQRFFSMLRFRKQIGIRNYFFWCMEAVRLIPGGINRILHANKMYLRGVRADVGYGGTDIPVCPRLADEAGEKRKRQARMTVPLYPEAIERMVWHAERGHLIMIMSGTLEPLAERTARALEAELRERGFATEIRVCATRLEKTDGSWTGRIVGEAVFGKAKARAVRRIASKENLDLRKCFAYGDSSSDRWMLEAVGKPAAVNPSSDLARIARRNDWPILHWGKEKTFTQRARRARRTQRLDESNDELQVARAKVGFRI